MAEYPIEELCDAFNTESHTELINNTPITTNKTTVAHNRAVGQIRRALEQFIESNNGNCEVFSENVALYCDELCNNRGNLFLPDVMSVCDETGIKDDGIHVTPRFIAEVTSISTRKQDYIDKMAIYTQIGVEEYWVIDLQRKVVVRYLADNEYVPELLTYET